MLDPSQLLWTRIGAGVCLLLTIGSFRSWMRMRGNVHGAKSWTRTEGQIIESRVDLPATHSSDDATDATPLVRYRYSAGGAVREGSRIKFGGQRMTRRMLAANVVARYPVGAKVSVYIDPAHPDRAVLEPRRQDNIVALLVFTVVFGAITAILAAHSVVGHVIYVGKGVPLFAYGLPLACFAVAIASVVSFLRDRRLARASATWPTAAGRITNCSVVEEEVEERGDGSTTVRKVPRYRVDLRYAYHADHREFVGTRAGWGWTAIYSSRKGAEAAAARYAQGQTVAVHYDPEDPAIAVLEPANRGGTWAPLIFGLMFAIGGAGMMSVFLLGGLE